MKEEPLEMIKQQLSKIKTGQLLMRKHKTAPDIPCFVQAFHAVSDGKGIADNYPLFPGITLTHSLYLANKFTFHHPPMESAMQINHCRYGRIGWEMHNDLNIYLGPGDLSIHMMDACAESTMSLPLGYYEGIAISVDLNVLEQEAPDILREAGVSGSKLREKFCPNGETTAMPASTQIEHIFSELYRLPDGFQIPYYKLKVQELFLFLSVLELDDKIKLDQYLSPQVEIIKAVHRQLTEHLETRYTIEELAKQHLINTTSLKAVFKTVYGAPIAAYMKAYRMNRAAELLRQTNDSIAEIAAKVGYENQSKFTTVFKDTFHLLPTAYRRQYRNADIL